METTQQFAVLSESEQVVRTYKCTKLHRLFLKPIIGFLSITNKRVVYHSEGKSIGGSSAVISEMPLEDVAGITSFAGNSFNFLLFFIVSGVLYLATFLLELISNGILINWVIGILLCIPYLIAILFEKNIINRSILESAKTKINNSSIGDFVKRKDDTFFMGIFKVLFCIGAPVLGYILLQGVPLIGFVLLLIAYVFVYLQLFGNFRSFSLQINSRTSKGSGILIPGNFMLALISGNTTAAQSVNAGPNEDSELILKELGALIMDIQQLGDFGIGKWKQIKL